MNTQERFEYHKQHIDGIADQYRLKEYTEQIIASIDELVSGSMSAQDASLEILAVCDLISHHFLWDCEKIAGQNFDVIIKKIENNDRARKE